MNIESGYAPISARADSAEHNSAQLDVEKNEYLFTYKDDSFDVAYAVNFRDTNVIKGMISVRITVAGKDRIVPIYHGGPIIRDEQGKDWLPEDTGEGRTFRLRSHELDGSTALFQYEEIVNEQLLHKAYRFSIQGKTLIMEATGDITNATKAYYAGFDLGKSRLTADPVMLTLPSISLPIGFIDNQYYLSTYVDPLLSTTGRYEITENVIRSRSMQATNTPAWLIEDAGGRRPPLHVISYLTISDKALDVAPSTAEGAVWADNPIRDRILVDLHQWPLVHRPYRPIETIRRWEAPDDGQVYLNGTFRLHSGESAGCSVLFQEAQNPKERVLFSQILKADGKNEAGMKGSFPVRRGDQLLFSASGPAVMTGGEVRFAIQIEHEGVLYHSFDDYSNRQGEKGWYYEQKIGGERLLMIWNPDLNQWESPFNRSLQKSNTLVCRAGAAGDAFRAAENFFQELRRLGLSDLAFLVRGWSDHAQSDFSPDAHHREDVWGAGSRLKELTQKESDQGSLFIPIVGGEQLGFSEFLKDLNPSVIMDAPHLLQSRLIERSADALRDIAAGVDQTMRRSGLWLEGISGLERIKRPDLYYQLLGVPEPSTASAEEAAAKAIRAVRAFSGRPLLLDWRDPLRRFDFYARPLFDGIASPLLKDSDAMNLVDEELNQGRKSVRIGFGSYEGFYQSASTGSAIDIRLFPLDQYLTSLTAYGRLPLISGNIWYAEMEERDMRRYLMETVCLLQPLVREYMNPANAVEKILYQTSAEPGKDLRMEDVIAKKLTDKIEHIKIQYSNGLQVFANRTGREWRIDEDNLLPLIIAGDGFWAHNPQTRLTALIGRQGERSYSMRRTPESFFLYSREGDLIRGDSFSTDGMLHRWSSTSSSQPNMACLGVMEVGRTNPIAPILRSNRRIDCCVQWKSGEEMDIRLLAVDDGPVLLEFFELPSEWLANDGEAISVACYRDGALAPQEDFQWYVTSSASASGIRLIDVRSGDRYVISHTDSAPETEVGASE
ncbi:MAG: hypothetical protein JXR73_11015 [Candidatus Omnitrophica bacterium]|nr:hypothetical protein [Candidatus Omnitrophota bacterium]